MRILLAHRCFYLKGGAEKVLFETASLLRSNGHEVAFFSMEDPHNKPSEFSKYFVPPVDYMCKDFFNCFKSMGRLLYSWEARRRIEELIAAWRPDVVHLHNIYHQISPSILHSLKKANIPVVMTLHDLKSVCANYYMIDHGKMCDACRGEKYYQCFIKGCVKNSHLKSIPNTIEMYLHHKLLHIYDLVDVFIAPSQFLKDKLVEMGFKGRIEVLSNFVDPKSFAPSFLAEERSILYVGRLSFEKGIKTLVEAVKGLDIDLKVVGDGPLLPELEEKVRNEGINNVRFLGYRSGNELKDEIRKSMFMVLPSECYENNPISVMEAFALGKPVIGARIGGIPELVKDGATGYTFTAFDTKDLRDKILWLANDPVGIERMGCNARGVAEQDLSGKKHYAGLMRIYGRVPVTIVYPLDPLSVKVGGIETFLKGFIKHAPVDFDISFVGITCDPVKRPVGKETVLKFGDKAFRFLPLFYEKDENCKTPIPLSLRFVWALFNSRLKFRKGVLLFNRIESIVMFLANKEPKVAFIHNDIEKQVVNGRSEVLWSRIPWLYCWLEGLIFKVCDMVCTVNTKTLAFYQGRYKECADKFSFVPTWVDTDVFSPLQGDRLLLRNALKKKFGDIDVDKQWILFVGRLQDQKAPLRLVRSFNAYLRLGRQAHLIIVGDGNLRSQVDVLVNELDLFGKITIIPRMEQSLLADFYRASDVLLLTSDFEGMPRCALEALGTGIPVVSTNAGEITRVVSNGYSGEVVDSVDPDVIAEKLRVVLAAPEVYTSVRCQASVRCFTPGQVLVPVYQGMCKLSGFIGE